VLGKGIKHDVLVSLILDKDVACWLDNISTQCTERGHLGFGSEEFVAEGSAFLARFAHHTRTPCVLILDQIIIPLHDLKMRENSQLKITFAKKKKKGGQRQIVNWIVANHVASHRPTDPYLHRRARLLAAQTAVAPNSQRRVTSDLPFKVSAHARPSSFRHDDESSCSSRWTLKYYDTEIGFGG